MIEVIFHPNTWIWERLQWSLFSGIWKHTCLCNKGVFLSIFSCDFDDQSSQNVHRLVMLCIWWDTGLWQLPNMSSAFKCTSDSQETFSTFKWVIKKGYDTNLFLKQKFSYRYIQFTFKKASTKILLEFPIHWFHCQGPLFNFKKGIFIVCNSFQVTEYLKRMTDYCRPSAFTVHRLFTCSKWGFQHKRGNAECSVKLLKHWCHE